MNRAIDIIPSKDTNAASWPRYPSLTGRSFDMTRLWPIGEPILMRLDEQGRPIRFTWQGQAHRLAQIHQQWQVDLDWWRAEGRIWRCYWAVTTTTGLFCVIYQDIQNDNWYLTKIYD